MRTRLARRTTTAAAGPSGCGRPSRVVVVVALLLSACRTAPAPVPPAREAAASAGVGSPSAVIFVPSSPAVLVASGELPFLVLDEAVSRGREGEPAFRIAYMASTETSQARAEDAPRRAVGAAAVLLEALTPALPRDVRTADVTAVFGLPGTWGVGVPVRFAREGGRWREPEIGSAHPVLVPPLPRSMARPTASEEAAVLAARRFLELADDGDYDAAWELASAAVKAAMSRKAFDEDLRVATPPGKQVKRRERFRQYEARSGDFRLGDVLQVCFETERGVDSIQVRLDDDQEWRVAHVAHLIAGERRGESATRSSAAAAGDGR